MKTNLTRTKNPLSCVTFSIDEIPKAISTLNSNSVGSTVQNFFLPSPDLTESTKIDTPNEFTKTINSNESLDPGK